MGDLWYQEVWGRKNRKLRKKERAGGSEEVVGDDKKTMN